MQGRKRPMPVGIEDFKKLVQGEYYFVDKTRFIRDLLDVRTDVTLITRPRRFGKTLALSMLQYFFTLENAEENRKLFEGLDIEKAGEEYMREQGTRPVVFLSLKEVQRPAYASMLAMLSLTLQELYTRHRQLLDDSIPDEPQAEYARRILAGTGSEEDMMVSLKYLMAYLERYYGKKPVLLLDELMLPSFLHGKTAITRNASVSCGGSSAPPSRRIRRWGLLC